MAKRLDPVVRRELSEKAHALYLERRSYMEIGDILGISRQLASTLVQEQKQERGREERGKEDLEHLFAEREKVIGTYHEVIRLTWQKLQSEHLNVNSTYVCGYLNTIIKAQSQIVRILGLNNYRVSGEDNSMEELTSAVAKMSSRTNPSRRMGAED